MLFLSLSNCAIVAQQPGPWTLATYIGSLQDGLLISSPYWKGSLRVVAIINHVNRLVRAFPSTFEAQASPFDANMLLVCLA